MRKGRRTETKQRMIKRYESVLKNLDIMSQVCETAARSYDDKGLNVKVNYLRVANKLQENGSSIRMLIFDLEDAAVKSLE